MKNFLRIASFSTVFLLAAVVLVPVFRAQNLGGSVRVSALPDGPFFLVDGQIYQHAMSAIWPTGSKHTLSIQSTVQDGAQSRTRYSFNGWQYNGTTPLPGGPTAIVSADPALFSYTAMFDVQYAIGIVFNACADGSNCSGPGTVYLGGTAITSNQDIYVGPGGGVTLMAVPNPGYVFTGWVPGPGQVIQGPVNTVTANAPLYVYAQFQKARPIQFTTIPAGLKVLADRTSVVTPVSLDWGWGTTHTVGPVSPQQDNQGAYWVFSSWSDGGSSTHAYSVAQVPQPDTLTATYVPAVATSLLTTPAGLKLKIDGRDNWPSYNFIWSAGEVHHLEAPAQQTDAQGRLWAFASWSNGGPAVQDFTVPPITAASGAPRLIAAYTPLAHLTVNSTLPGLSVKVDGQDCTTPCDLQRAVGAVVRVSAPASVPVADGVRADFSGWPGSGSLSTDWSLTLGADPVTLSANYRTMNRLAISSAPADGASWSLLPGSPDGYYDAQATVSIAVTSLPGFRFHAWSGDLSGSRPTGVLAMSAPRAVQAQLDRVPYIAPAGVANAAGTTPQTGVAPGSIISIFGASLTAETTVGPPSPLAQTLGGITVRAGDRFMPLFFTSPSQINLLLPDDLPLGQQSFTVSSQGLPDVQASVTVVRDAPGLFAQLVNDQAFAVVVHEDGTPVTTDSPALRGELLTIYGTGFGPADHRRPDGFAIPTAPAFLLVDPASVLVGDATITPENAFVAPGRVGIDALQFRLGDSAPAATNANLHVTVNGQDSNIVLLPVQ